MKRRGLGMVFQRGSTWWIQYHWRGQRYRETSGSTVRMDAIKLLRHRMAEMSTGQLRGPDLEKTTFADLVQIIRDDYTVNQRRSTRRLETSLKVLEPAFGRMRACDITLDRLNHYVSERMATGIAPATAKLELTHLHKAFRLAERAGKAICPPFPQITVRNVRTGFFERADFEAVRSHLPEAFQGPITFACLTCWRVPSEILTLRWKQVDFSAGMVRLEPGTTKNDEGRVFPFACCRSWRPCYRHNGTRCSLSNWRLGNPSPPCSTGTTEGRSRRFIRRRSIIGGRSRVNGQGCRRAFPTTSGERL